VIIEQQTSQPTSSSNLDRTRIAIVAVVVVLAVAIGAVLGSVLIARGGAPLAGAAAYVPEDAVIYAEARLDLPGAQRDNLRALLERFPAADADAILTDALADTLDGALAGGGAPFDYSNDIAPWFDGTVAVAMLDYPLNADPMQMQAPAGLVLFGVRDSAAAADFADTVRGQLEEQGAAFTSSDHDGTTVWSLQVDPATMGMVSGMGFAYAVAGDQLIMATGDAQVSAALDTRSGGKALADRGDVGRLMSSLPDERSGVMVVNSEAMLSQMRAQLESSQPALADALAPYLDAAPPITVGALSLASDAMLLDTVSALPDGPAAPSNGSRTLAEMVPADAIFYADSTRVGATLETFVAAMKASLASGPDGDAMLQQLDQVEAALGADLEELVNWIGAGAMTAGWDGEEVYVGLVLDAIDPTAAERRLSQLRSFAELAATDPSSGISVQTGSVNGVEVTTLRVEQSGALAFGTPFAPALQYAIDGDRVVIGLGDRFVEAALGMDAADSFARSDRYATAVERFGGADNAATVFVDLAALRQAAEVGAGMQDDPGYAQIKPNLEPFDYLVGVTRVSGDRVVAREGLVLR